MGKNQLQNWKPAVIDYSALSAKDFESFGGIEELNEYQIIKAGRGKSFQIIKSGRVKKKKSSKKKKAKMLTEVSIESHTENEEIDMSAWCNCCVPDEILSALRNLGFQKPTEIQELALPHAIRDHLDILAAAETGSGKTLAFGIPVITHIMATKKRESVKPDKASNTLRGLVLLPTRELAIQVKNHLQAVAKNVDVKIISIVGGMSQEKQHRLLQKSPDIIVATPGRLWQLMEEGVEYLEQIPFVRYLVIDEADRMVEQGHFEELAKILELMNDKKMDKRRQNFVFSATLTMVHELPKRLELKQGKVKKDKLQSLMKMVGISEKPKIIDITRKTALVETLTESQITCSLEEKDVYLYYFIVMYPGRTLVFCNSVSCVRRLKSVLEYLGCKPLALHASMHQRQRLKNLDTFTASEHGLLLATDVAARGLDIRGIEHVVHFQVPRTAEIYVHRSGRTARAQSEGLSLVLMEHQEVVVWSKICRTLNKDKALPLFPVDLAVLKVIKERVMLARSIDQQEHRVKRLSAQNRWFRKAAEDMDVDLDDENMLNDLGDERSQANEAKKLKLQKKQLNRLLRQTVLPRKILGSYPTKTGKLQLPSAAGTEKAVHVLKDSSKLSSILLNKKRKKR